VFTESFKKIETIASAEAVAQAKIMLNEFLTGGKFTEPPLEEVLKELPEAIANKIRAVVENRYRDKSSLDIDNLESFGDKILAYQKIKSKNNVSMMLWKLKKIRDDISHGRIQELTYEDKPLMERAIKEKLLLDYMGVVNNPDHKKSGLDDFIKLSPEDEEKVKDLLKRI